MNVNYDDIGLEHLGIKTGLEMVLIKIILDADGSTTRLLETLVGETVTVKLHQQDFFRKKNLPLETTRYFKSDGEFLYRLISLHYRNESLSDNVVITPKSGLDSMLRERLAEGQIPLGKLINETEHCRKLISANIIHSSEVQHQFYSIKLKSGFFPVKKYLIIKDGESWFYICEFFNYETIYKYFTKMISGVSLTAGEFRCSK
jgi:chorismate-pyruvate lyase